MFLIRTAEGMLRWGLGLDETEEGVAPNYFVAKAFNPQRLNQSSSAQPV